MRDLDRVDLGFKVPGANNEYQATATKHLSRSDKQDCL